MMYVPPAFDVCMIDAGTQVNHNEGRAMRQTGIVINKESWGLLQEEPLYCPRFIDRTGTDELALVVRVELIDFFLDAQLPSPSTCPRGKVHKEPGW